MSQVGLKISIDSIIPRQIIPVVSIIVVFIRRDLFRRNPADRLNNESMNKVISKTTYRLE